MAFEQYVNYAGKPLRLGFTTGACAALAAGAAARMLLTGAREASASIVTPKGIPVETDLIDVAVTAEEARCAVRKDAGDDPDATDGVLVYATVRKRSEPGVDIDGGVGVGRVTKRGLDQPPGAAAINSAPRRMIRDAVENACRELRYDGGMTVIVSIPEGEKLAGRTFNPHLGIVGGISVIGTSGIVEPMSSAAILDTIRLEMNVLREAGARDIVLTPGNYGEEFVRGFDALAGRPHVKCSNFIGDALDNACGMGFETVLVVGHIGKLVKLAGGVMDTHSRVADCRLELVALHAALAGLPSDALPAILAAATVDDGLALTGELRDAVVRGIAARADGYLRRRARGAFRVGVVIFSGGYGFLAASQEAEAILARWRSDG